MENICDSPLAGPFLLLLEELARGRQKRRTIRVVGAAWCDGLAPGQQVVVEVMARGLAGARFNVNTLRVRGGE